MNLLNHSDTIQPKPQKSKKSKKEKKKTQISFVQYGAMLLRNFSLPLRSKETEQYDMEGEESKWFGTWDVAQAAAKNATCDQHQLTATSSIRCGGGGKNTA